MKILVSIILLLALIAVGSMAVPTKMYFQGKFTDDLGDPMDGDFPVTFTIWDSPITGTPFWTESRTITFNTGLFAEELGLTEALPESIFTGAMLYLEMVVDGDVIEPRKPLITVPYAFRAAIADSVVGGSVNYDMLVTFIEAYLDTAWGDSVSHIDLVHYIDSVMFVDSITYIYNITHIDSIHSIDSVSYIRYVSFIDSISYIDSVRWIDSISYVDFISFIDSVGYIDSIGWIGHTAYADSAGRLVNALTPGTGIDGDPYDGSVARTWTVSGGSADDWGDDTVHSDATLDGRGTAASPLKIARQSASSGQILKWNGLSWIPASDDTGTGGATSDADWQIFGSDMYSIPTGNVGIGITSPAYKLHVQNTGGASSAKIGYTSSYYDNRLFFGDNSYVYIGEMNADDRLYLRGTSMSIDIGGNLGSSGQVLKSTGSTLYWANDETGSGGSTSPGGTNGAVQFNNSSSFGGSASQFYWNNSNNRLGIGTSSPSAKLTISYASTDIYGIYVTMPGWAIYGDASGGGGRGVMGRGGEYGILGNHLSTDRMGYIGSANYGVYGQYDANNYAFLGGQVSGNNAGMKANGEWVSGFFGDYTKSVCGERGIYSIGTIYGLFARDTCGTVTISQNYAYLGYHEISSPNTQYGILASGNDYAGFFIGTTYFDVGSYDWQTDYSAGEPTLHPTSASWGYVGTSSLNWWRMYANTYYSESSSIELFDTYDDLALLHQIEGDVVWDPILGHHKMAIRPETMPRCITNYEENSDRLFVSAQRTDGLLIGAIRQLDNEAKTRDQRITERTDVLAEALGADFQGESAQIKIFDFGSSIVINGSKWVAFSSDFASQLGGETPVITLTAHSPDAGLWIAEKSPYGFLIRSKNPNSAFDFDWSAFARVEIKTSGALGDVFYIEKPLIHGTYPVDIPGLK